MLWRLSAVAAGIAAAAGAGLLLARASYDRPSTPDAQRPTPVAPPASPSAPQMPDPAAIRRDVEATVTARPQDYALRMQAAEVYMRVGLNAQAIPHLKVATRLRPGELLPWLALGDAATLSSQPAVATRALDRVAALAPDHPLLYRSRGQLLVQERRLAEARRLLEKGYRRHPGEVEIAHALGNVLLVMGQPRAAIEVLSAALREAPDRADLHYLLGDAYERDHHVESALKEMQEAARLEPRMDEAWGRSGLYLVNLTRFQEARAPLERAIQLNPSVSYYHWALGDSYLNDPTAPDYFSRALASYRQALKLDPNNEKALYSFAMALTRRGTPADLQEALPPLNRLLRQDPRKANVHYKLSETYRLVGRSREAEQHLRTFRQLTANNQRQAARDFRAASFRDTAAAHLALGREAMARQDFALATREFLLALERDPKLPGAREALDGARRAAGSAR
jgi:tetratricopeptide (TPR) repeat protein